MTGTGGLQRIPRNVLENYQIPVPPLQVQETIVAEIKSHQIKIVEYENRIAEETQAIKNAIARVWGE